MKKSLVLIIPLIIFVIGLIVSLNQLKRNRLLVEHNININNVYELIDDLENNELTSSIRASISKDVIKLNIEGVEYNIQTPDELFYLALAPYIELTHECYQHSLTGCQGELTDKSFLVKVYDDSDRLIMNEYKNSGSDGFIGLYLEKDENYRVVVSYDSLQSEFLVDTAEEQTCFTEVELR